MRSTAAMMMAVDQPSIKTSTAASIGPGSRHEVAGSTSP